MKPSHLALLAGAGLALLAPDAGAAERTLTVDGTTADACHTTWRAGEPGVATTTVPLPGPRAFTVELRAGSGDWDLAVFDGQRRPLTGGASPGGREIADGIGLGEELLVQACRRAGGADAATVTSELAPLPEPQGGKIQIVEVKTPTRADKNRLTRLGFDLTEHGHADGLGVVLHGDEDAAKLRAAGFEYEVEIPDLAARTLRDRQADRTFSTRVARSSLPSGRDTYRTLADYEIELKTLAQQNPGLVRLVELPNKTWLGRTVLGIEITENVNLNDGKPVFANLGVHHAREWPSGEHAMEWAYELVNGFKRGDARATKIVRQSRNIVVPIVNPDGFNASRSAGALPLLTDVDGDDGRDEGTEDTAYIVAGAINGGEYRRKNCRVLTTEEGNCLTSVGLAENGTDPNRNYGALWGGPGADTNPLTQTYRGPAPFSEPETRNIQWLVSRNQVTTLITNHTTAGLVLRAPGLASLGDPVDENKGYKDLGDAMAKENGYFSQKSFELYDTTGTTEDWSYNATGGLGFTFEIYCGAPNYETGDCDDPAFHPSFATMVKEWDGTSNQSNHVGDPGRSDATPFGMQPNYDGKGNREAYYIAAESTINAARHSVVTGEAPAGVRLRIRKEFKTATFPQGDAAQPILFDDKLESVYDVGADGKVEWHMNPSTRPIVAKQSGKAPEGPPSPKVDGLDGGAINAPVPCPTYHELSPPVCLPGGSTVDHPFTFPVGGGVDNASATIRFNFDQGSDWDLEIYVDTNGDNAPDGAPIAESGNGFTNGNLGFEEVTLPRPNATTRYVARMINYAALPSSTYEGEVTFNAPPPFQPAVKEAWTLTCEKDGRTLETQQLLIERGERKELDLAVCRKALAAAQNTQTPQVPTAQPDTCTAGGGFRTATARAAGRRVALAFSRRVARPVTVDVFQQSVGRRVIGERLVARFSGRSAGLTWNGRANRRGRTVTDGYYFARYTMANPGGGTDVRRVTLRRVRGRWSTRPAFYRPESCQVVRSYKLTRPVFGGRGSRPVEATFRLTKAARVGIEVLRGGKVVKRFAPAQRRADRTYRLRLAARGLARGDHQFRLTAVEGGRTTRLTLTSRRL